MAVRAPRISRGSEGEIPGDRPSDTRASPHRRAAFTRFLMQPQSSDSMTGDRRSTWAPYLHLGDTRHGTPHVKRCVLESAPWPPRVGETPGQTRLRAQSRGNSRPTASPSQDMFHTSEGSQCLGKYQLRRRNDQLVKRRRGKTTKTKTKTPPEPKGSSIHF